MPTFPTCSDTLPKCLQFFKPFHYLLLGYWIYFRPNSLKFYFYQAIPELYNAGKPIGLFRKWGTPAFRNIFVMMPVICMLLAGILGGIMALLSAWTLNVPVNWARWLEGGMLGVALGMTIGMAFGMVGRVIGGIALSTMVGIMYGVTVGVLGGVSFSVALGIPFTDVTDGAIIVGAVFGVLGGMAFTLDIEIGIALSLAFATMATLAFGAEFIFNKTFGVRFGALLVRGMMSGAFVMGAFRVLLYPLQCILALCSVFRQSIHPITWDELTILPLPLTRRMMFQKLHQNEHSGLQFLIEIGRNLFRRTALKAVLYRYFHNHPNPLRFLYHLLRNPAMKEYLLVPVTYQNWEQYVSVRHVFLGELALRPVEAMKYPRFRRSSWWLNLRERPPTPLTQFAGMLYVLLDEHRIKQEGVDLNTYKDIYSGLVAYPGGEGIVRSYETMTIYLSYQILADLPGAENVGLQLALSIFFHDAITPAVLMALTRLGHIGKDITEYLQGTERQVQFTALARATGDLNEINEYVIGEVIPPEQYLLQRIISQWQQIILTEIGTFGKSEIIPETQTEDDKSNHDASLRLKNLPL